jgi:hypothetical protein
MSPREVEPLAAEKESNHWYIPDERAAGKTRHRITSRSVVVALKSSPVKWRAGHLEDWQIAREQHWWMRWNIARGLSGVWGLILGKA